MNVSRETTERLEKLAALVLKWNNAINLISKSSVSDIWDRHIMDSAQLFDMAGQFEHWVDIGSGGGFPGLVVSVIALEKMPEARFTLVESDQRKCAYLETAKRELNLNVEVIAKRVDEVAPLCADVFSARALADLSTLCLYAHRHMAPSGVALFPKGENFALELAEAQKQWHFTVEARPSRTQKNAVVLALGGITHV